MAATGRKSGLGCLGCLGKTAVILVFGALLVLGIDAVFAPWSFFLGGKFHVLPYWQGWGRLHSKISGDYALFVRMDPSKHNRYGSGVTGTGYICTPRGETFRLSLSGGMRQYLNLSTDGEAIRFTMYYNPLFSFANDQRPKLDLRGHWRNPNLVMNDNRTISYAFLPDGSVYHGQNPNRPFLDVVQFVLSPGSYSDFKSACASIRH